MLPPLLLPRSQLLNKAPQNQLGKVHADHPWMSFRREQIGSSKISIMNKTSQLTKWRNTSSSSSSIAKIALGPFQKKLRMLASMVAWRWTLSSTMWFRQLRWSTMTVARSRRQVKSTLLPSTSATVWTFSFLRILHKPTSCPVNHHRWMSPFQIQTAKRETRSRCPFTEQFVTKIVGPNKLQTTISDLYSSWSTELVFETFSRWLVSYRKLFSTAPKSTFRKDDGSCIQRLSP